MLRINRVSPATTGFVTTLVLTCAFAGLAVTIWMPRGTLAIATGDAGASNQAAAPPVQQAAR